MWSEKLLKIQCFRMGDTCTPVTDSCGYMAKPTTILKVISLQLKLILKRYKVT